MPPSQQSPPSSYRLGKSVIQSTPISSTYNIQQTTTQQVWKCKVFDLKKIEQYDMLTVLQYNEEVFTFLKDKYENSLYLQKTFQKDSNDFMVVEYWDERLSTYIGEKFPSGLKDKVEVKGILQDVLMSVCDIYAENYMILNLRPQHVVRIYEPIQGSLGWKIQSLVFEFNTFGLPQKCEYEFDYDWASNEEKAERENLDQLLKDEQIVWYMGILALRLVYGQKFKINQKFKDSDVNLTELKTRCLPQVYELIQKSVKANIKDRITLKSFLNLSIFSEVQIDNEVKKKFITGNSQRIKKSSIMRSSILQKSISRKSNSIFKMTVSSQIRNSQSVESQGKQSMKNSKLQVKELSQIKAQKMFNELRWMLEKCFFLAEIKDYTQTAASVNNTSIEDKTLIRYLYFKIAQINLKRFTEMLEKDPSLQSFRKSHSSKELYQELLDCIRQNAKSQQKKSILDEALQYENKIKKLDPKQLKLLSGFENAVSDLKKNVSTQKVSIKELAEIFALVNGKFFSSLKIVLERSQSVVESKGIKKRALCFFILSAYVVLTKSSIQSDSEQLPQLLDNDFKTYKVKFYDEERLQGSIHVKFIDEIEYIRLCEFTKRAKQEALIDNCQQILHKFFKTVNSNERIGLGPEKQAKKIRTSLRVPGR